MIRRDFIKHSSAVTAASLLIGNAKSWSGANDRIRVANIGLGGRGRQLMMEASNLDGVDVAMICEPDERRLNEAQNELEKASGKKAKPAQDLRKAMDEPGVDAVVITCCNHWHALAGIWACQAGKHVYVEKPVSHNIFEGRKLVEASRKYNRIMQGGTQRRSYGLYRKAFQLLHEGVIGDIYMARGLIFGVRDSIGFKPVKQPPAWLDWNVWLGPAPMQSYHDNLVHYNWHWFWDFGNGELGNNGSHCLDVVRWGLNKGLPSKIYSQGGRFGYEDQGQTPNTQACTFTYDDGTVVTCETRGLYTNGEAHNIRWGAMFYGSKGYMAINDAKYEIYMGRSKKPEPDQGRFENIDHFQNFFDAIRADDRSIQQGEIEEIYLSCVMCHLGNIAFRLGRELHFDPKTEKYIGDDEANDMLTREYRKPFVVPENI